MCFMCDRWGEGGRWYLNPKVYSRRMYKLRASGEQLRQFGEAGPELTETAESVVNRAVRLRNDEPAKFPQAQKEAMEAVRKRGGAQAVCLRELFDIVDMGIGMPYGSMMCICRKGHRAIEEKTVNEYSCLGTGVGMLKWERWPERYRGGVHFMSREETKEWLEKLDKRGFMHLVMLIGNDYVEGICNCEYPDCEQIRQRLDLGVMGLIKGHYVADIDYDFCNGCGVCVQRCQFGAAKFEVGINKTNIDQFRCFGCGLCEKGCPRGAIKLVERASLPALKEAW